MRVARKTGLLILPALALGCASVPAAAPGARRADVIPAAEARGAAEVGRAATAPAPAPPAAAPATARPGPRAAAAPAPPAAAPGTVRPGPRAGALAVGSWRLLDGAPGSEITLELKADGTWVLSGASYRSGGTYRWVGAEELETTVVASNLESEIGAVTRRRVTVDGTELSLGAPQRADGKRRPDEAAGARRYRRVDGR